MKNTCKKEYGDFQTPIDLALDVCEKLKEMGVNPEIIIEPTCGTGSFIEAVFRKFEKCNKIIGIEINDKYIDSIKLKYKDNSKIDIINGNFFTFNWFKILNDINSSVLFLGNLPWVTNAEVGGLNGSNLPKKNNFQNITGFNAMMGESNFDISEWMLIKIIELVKFIPNNNVFIAFLIKTSVARRILNYMHKNNMPGSNINIFCIDAKKEFNVSVDACLFTCNFASKEYPINCSVFDNLHSLHPSNILGFRNNALVNDVKKAEKTEYLYSPNQKIWRSGIKHDCSSVMEFIIKEDGLYNGFNEKVELEDSYLFPLLKSSDIANGRVEIKETGISSSI